MCDRGYRAFGTKRFYIDSLRKEIRSGNLTPFFYVPNEPTDNDYVWVGKGSPEDDLLQQVVSY